MTIRILLLRRQYKVALKRLHHDTVALKRLPHDTVAPKRLRHDTVAPERLHHDTGALNPLRHDTMGPMRLSPPVLMSLSIMYMTIAWATPSYHRRLSSVLFVS